ncbi:MAG: hypothetical protein ACKOCT_07340, partial [Alphaproteobacteria bacterium]
MASTAVAADVPGGGPRSRDCVTFFRTVAAPVGGGSSIRCTDGDSTCDADGAVDGACTFEVRTCVNGTRDASSCLSPGVEEIVVDHALDDGDPLFDPAFQALQARIDGLDLPTSAPDACTAATRIVVPLEGLLAGNRCRGARKVVRTRAVSLPISGIGRIEDSDVLRLSCAPAPDSCIPTTLFEGTFDRIQAQVFDRSCAISGCHDSQTRMAGLLLEVGASWSNLVGVDPSTQAAGDLGWKRVSPGDATTSLLLRKVAGDLGPGLGERMPWRRKALPSRL